MADEMKIRVVGHGEFESVFVRTTLSACGDMKRGLVFRWPGDRGGWLVDYEALASIVRRIEEEESSDA